jgi:hypothetical protein
MPHIQTTIRPVTTIDAHDDAMSVSQIKAADFLNQLICDGGNVSNLDDRSVEMPIAVGTPNARKQSSSSSVGSKKVPSEVKTSLDNMDPMLAALATAGGVQTPQKGGSASVGTMSTIHTNTRELSGLMVAPASSDGLFAHASLVKLVKLLWGEDTAAVQQSLTDLNTAVCDDPVETRCASIIIRLGGPLAVLKAMEKHRDAVVSDRGLTLLMNLAYDNPEAKLLLMDLGGVETAVTEMQRCRNDGPNVERSGAGFLQNLAFSDAADVRLVAGGAVHAVVAALWAWPEDVQLQEYACSTLYNLATTENPRARFIVKQALLEAGGFAALGSACDHHPTHPKIPHDVVDIYKILATQAPPTTSGSSITSTTLHHTPQLRPATPPNGGASRPGTAPH